MDTLSYYPVITLCGVYNQLDLLTGGHCLNVLGLVPGGGEVQVQYLIRRHPGNRQVGDCE